MKKYIIVLIASMMATVAMAQETMTPLQKREFYQKAYELITDYAQSSSIIIDDQAKKRKFTRLFNGANIMICNDLMGLNTKPRISVNNYVNELYKNAKSAKVEIKNLKKKGDVQGNDSVWIMKVSFDKFIEIKDRNYVYFNSRSFYKDDFHIVATLYMDKNDGHCYIAALDAEGEWPQFPEDYRVLVESETDKRDKKLAIGSDRTNVETKVEYTNNQYILRPDEIVYYKRGKVDLVPEGDEGNRKFHADYEDKSWSVRANMGFSLSDFNKLDGADGISMYDNSEMSYGVDFGYLFRSTSDLQVGIFAGLGISSNKFSLRQRGNTDGMPYDDSFTSDQDEDEEEYTRYYKLWGGEGISQTVESSSLVIPVYADFEYTFTQLISAYADLGVKLQTTSGKMSATVDNYETWGKYDDKKYGFPLTIRTCDDEGNILDNSLNLNGFGLYNTDEKKPIDVDENGTSSKLSINVLLGVGLRLNLTKTMAIDAGLQYIGGGKSWEYKGKPSEKNYGDVFSFSLPSDKDGWAMTSKEDKAKGDRVNLLRKAKGVKQGAMRLAVSFIYKF